jgi:uncharacterized protein
VNRARELAVLDEAARSPGLLVLYGRRRLGKTRLITEWLDSHPGLYTQAIEGIPALQLQQVFQDLSPSLETKLVPTSWEDLFEILDLQRRDLVLAIDEFPYLASSDSSLPSRIQKWLDHRRQKNLALILSGSSTRMMADIFLNEAAPLFGRARRVVRVDPLSYEDFCRALKLRQTDPETFLKFSLVGGVPRYWEFVRPGASAIDLADELFFGFAPYMENEPRRVLRDERVEGLSPISLLEVVGRGAERPSEIASRLVTVQTNLSPLLAKLNAAAILGRELPFGESERNSKRVLYKITDPALRFWYRVYSPHRTLWRTYDPAVKLALLQTHAGSVFEDVIRARHPGSGRYWEKDLEIDMIRPEKRAAKGPVPLVVTEIKWRRLSARETRSVLEDLKRRWQRSRLAKSHPQIRFEVLDSRALGNLDDR